jgi:hypothetical protein
MNFCKVFNDILEERGSYAFETVWRRKSSCVRTEMAGVQMRRRNDIKLMCTSSIDTWVQCF